MKHIKRIASMVGLLMVMSVSAGTVVTTVSGCQPETPAVEVIPVEGTYYADVDGAEYSVAFTQTSVTFSVAGETLEGTYSYDGTTNITVTLSDGQTVTATLTDGVLSFTYDGITYTMLERISYTVTYNLDGGTGEQSAEVVNGRLLERPADPTKTGYRFVGWYTDSAFTTPFSFSTPITGNTTLYARFVLLTIAEDEEFTVSFDAQSAGEQFDSVRTVGHCLYNLPRPTDGDRQFLGWWMSDYESADKLTAQVVDGQELDENTTLYAVWADDAPIAVSVDEDGVEWTSAGMGSSYRISITNSSGESVVGNSTTLSQNLAYDFASAPADDYVVEVTTGSTTVSAYYRNKGLARVSLFEVEGSTLIFNAVDGADNYYLSYVCGTAGHTHTDIELGATNSYDFSACDMREEGIQFTVTAAGDGYLSSVSDEFIFERTLPAVAGLTVDSATDVLSWDAVPDAESYDVEIVNDENSQTLSVTGTQLDLQSYYGALEISVTPVNHGYNSPDATTYTYNKTRLATPSNIRASGTRIVWDAVEGAESYRVTINSDDIRIVYNNYLELEGEYEELAVTVQAEAVDSANNSFASPVASIARELTGLAYNAGAVSWNSVIGVAKYGVRVNGGEETIVEDALSCPVTLTRDGDNIIEVRFYSGDEPSDVWEAVTVEAGTVTLDRNDGLGTTLELYYAVGDAITLPADSRTGYVFNGYATSAVNGQIVNSGTIFNGDVTYYAQWTANNYEVTLLIPGDGAFDDNTTRKSVDVAYGSGYTLPIPQSTDATLAFNGWYSEPLGGGTRYTNSEGESLVSWNIDSDSIVLYPGWTEAFTYTVINHPTMPGESAIRVSQGTGSRSMKKLRIPATYEVDGQVLPVTTVAAGAFSGCSLLEVVEIPDSIIQITTGNEGSNSASSAFVGCSALLEINVYDASESFDRDYVRYYSSVDGILLYNNEITGMQLAYVQRGLEGTFEIPKGVVSLPQYIFASTYVEEVIVPASVMQINNHAFDSSHIESIVFLAAADGEEEVPLTFSGEVFFGANITELTLPGRVTELTRETFVGDEENRDPYESWESKLTSITISGESSVYSSADGILLTNNGTNIFYCPAAKSGVIDLPAGILTIGEGAFLDCKLITGVIIPESVTTIGKEAFSGCSLVSSLVFEGDENSLPLTICESAFYGCRGLNEVVLPANLQTLEIHAFGGISDLTKVTVNSVFEEINFANGAFASESSSTVTGIGTTYVTELVLGSGVRVFDVMGVFGEAGLTSVTVDAANPYYTSVDGILFNNDITQIVYYPSGKQDTSYTLPETVKVIGASVFYRKDALETIVIGYNVETIGSRAFYQCANLSKLVFTPTPAGQEEVPLTIGDEAFYNCDGLTDFNLPERTVSIGGSAFEACDGLVNIVIPDNVTSIGGYAFERCANLESVKLPASLEEIGGYIEDTYDYCNNTSIFYECDKLSAITMDDTGTHFGVDSNVLYGKNADGELSVLYFSPYLNAGVNGVITVPGTVTEIKDRAFYNNINIHTIIFNDLEDGATLTVGSEMFATGYGFESNLTNIDLPQGLTSIGAGMFTGTRLTEISIPNTVTSIGAEAFYNCIYLETVTFEEDGTAPLVIEDGIMSSSNYYGAFSGCVSLKTIELPARTSQIGAYAFSAGRYNSNSVLGYTEIIGLQSIEIPSSIANIGEYAFVGAVNLTEVNFFDAGSSSLAIENNAFVGTNIQELILPEGTRTIGQYAFSESGLVSIYIPSSVTQLGDPNASTGYGPFYNCQSLKRVEFGENSQIEVIVDSSFYRTYNLEYINLEACTSLTEIRSLAFWYSGVTEITLPASIEVIEISAFNSADRLASVEFLTEVGDDGVARSNLRSIAATAFQGTAISEFVFPETTATSITLGNTLFQNCRNLTYVHLSTGVTSLGSALSGANFIETISIADSNLNFRADAAAPLLLNVDGTAIRLAYGSVITGDEEEAGTYRIPDGFTEIGDSAFRGQNAIRKLIIPASVRTIGNNAFRYCFSLEEVVFEENSELTSIGDYAFANCSNLTTVNLPNGLQTLNGYAFAYSGLTEITIPRSVTQIDTYVFAYNKALKNVTVLAAFENQSGYNGANMFLGCGAIEEVVLGDAFKEIPANMFSMYSAAEAEAQGNVLSSIDLRYVTEIGSSAFRYRTGLESVTLGANLAEMTGTYIFAGCTGLTTVMSYNSAGNIIGAQGSVTLPDSLTKIGNYCFDGSGLTGTVTLGQNLTTVGTYLFRNTAITEAILDLSINVPNYMFNGCESLTTVSLSTGITSIGTYAFQNCTNLKTVRYFDPAATVENADGTLTYTFVGEDGYATFADTLTTLNNYAFSGSGIEHLVAAGIDTMGTYVFYKCEDLLTADLTGSVFEVGNYAFRGCISLTEVLIPDATAIGTSNSCYSFADCESLERVVLGEGLIDIMGRAFQNCYALSTIDVANGDEVTENEEGVFTFPSTLTLIRDYAFESTAVRELHIPASLTGIGYNATSPTTASYVFRYCENLEKVVVPSTLTYIGRGAFSYCPNLKTFQYTDGQTVYGEEGELTLSSSVTMLGQDAFRDTGFTKVTVPASVERLGTYLFAECENLVEAEYLTDYVTGSSASTYATYMFAYCSNLTTVVLSSAIEVLPDYMFRNCTSLNTIKLYDGTEYIGEEGAVTLPEGLTAIRSGVFVGDSGITSLTLPEGLISIGADALLNTGVSSIIIPSTVTSISNNAFSPGMEITVASGNKSFFMQSGALVTSAGVITHIPASFAGELDLTVGDYAQAVLGAYSLNGRDGITKVIVSTDQIVANSFAYFSGEVEVVLGTSTELPANAFSNYAGTQITLPEGLTSIGQSAFEGTAITGITIPSTVTSLGMYVFEGCASLESIVLPDSITQIDSYLFTDCTALKSVTLPAGLTVIEYRMFEGCTALESIVLPEGITEIGQNAFLDCISLRSINIPSGCTDFGTSAFENCSSLESITIPEALTYSGSVFEGCTGLKEIIFNATAFDLAVTFSGSAIFAGCENVERVVIGENVTIIPGYLFSGMANIKEIILPEGLVSIGRNAFAGTGITEITIPTTVVNLSGYTTNVQQWFSGCASLETVYLPTSFTYIYQSMFLDCTSLKNVYYYELDEAGNMVVLSDTTKEGADLSYATGFDTSAFSGCSSLQYVTLPEGLTELANSTFEGCGLVSVTLPESLTNIRYAFRNCTSIETFVIHAGIINVFADAFEGWTSDQTVIIYRYAYDSASAWANDWMDNTDANFEVRIIYEGDVYGNAEEEGAGEVPEGSAEGDAEGSEEVPEGSNEDGSAE